MQPKDMAFQPIPGLKTARFAGMSTFMRLPHLELDNLKLYLVKII